MKIPRLGFQLELQLPASTRDAATQDLSCIYDLLHSSWNTRSLTHWARPGIEPTSSEILVSSLTAEPWQKIPCDIFLVTTILTHVRWCHIVVFTYISLMICNSEHLFLCLLSIFISLVKCPFRSSPYFLIRLFFVCLLLHWVVWAIWCFLFFVSLCDFCCFLGPHPWHMDVSRLGSLQLLAYTTATATWNLSNDCYLHNSSWQPHPGPLSEAWDQTHIFMDSN